MLLATTGVVVGGWNYVWIAYGVTWTVLLGYSVSLWMRRRDRREEGS